VGGTPFGGRIGRYYDDSEPWWPPVVRPPDGTPNVVVVVLDDVGFAQLGCYGSDIDTPAFDALAGDGLQFTNFHTTAVCSATRAALLTGRNHHSSGMGRVIEVSTGFPGYNAQIPPENGFLSEILLSAGFATYAIGKWHLTPDDECHSAASRSRWPLSRGFERFYGFMGGETHQFVPALIEDNHLINAVERVRDDYHLTEDLADHAMGCIRDLRAVDPAKPFFLYFATGACHAPHQAPAEWVARYRGRFDGGWDAWREETFARQKASGVMPAGARLSPLPAWVPTWDSLSAGEHRLYARYMEAFAGFLSHTDDQVGRLCAFLRDLGELDNTLLVLLSDNGAASEGGPTGSNNLWHGWNQYPVQSLAETLERIDEIGGPRCHSSYPWGWTVAGNTPFQRWKREVHEGGVADPLVVHWPRRLGECSGLRRQYLHVIDLAPTILELVGVEAPSTLKSIPQSPMEGLSMADAWKDARSPIERHTQYYEMFGNRALYHEGWKAVTEHPYMADDPSFDDDTWELYHVDDDVSECEDLAEAEPAKLRELMDRWWIEAGRYQVLPLDNRPISDFVLEKPISIPVRARYVYLPGAAQVPEALAVNVKNRSHVIEADVDIAEGTAPEGVLLGQGSFLGGWCLYVRGGRLTYAHNLGSREVRHIRADPAVPTGRRTLAFRFAKTGNHAGTGRLFVDGELVGEGEIPRFTPVRFSLTGAGMTCGYSGGLAVTDEIDPPFRFTGTIHRVVVTVDGPAYTDPEGEAHLAITTQ
jgi:arylsulfatase A-like enzyme